MKRCDRLDERTRVRPKIVRDARVLGHAVGRDRGGAVHLRENGSAVTGASHGAWLTRELRQGAQP